MEKISSNYDSNNSSTVPSVPVEVSEAEMTNGIATIARDEEQASTVLGLKRTLSSTGFDSNVNDEGAEDGAGTGTVDVEVRPYGDSSGEASSQRVKRLKLDLDFIPLEDDDEDGAGTGTGDVEVWPYRDSSGEAISQWVKRLKRHLNFMPLKDSDEEMVSPEPMPPSEGGVEHRSHASPPSLSLEPEPEPILYYIWNVLDPFNTLPRCPFSERIFRFSCKSSYGVTGDVQ